MSEDLIPSMRTRLVDEIAKVVVGQDDTVELILIAMIVGGILGKIPARLTGSLAQR